MISFKIKTSFCPLSTLNLEFINLEKTMDFYWIISFYKYFLRTWKCFHVAKAEKNAMGLRGGRRNLLCSWIQSRKEFQSCLFSVISSDFVSLAIFVFAYLLLRWEMCLWMGLCELMHVCVHIYLYILYAYMCVCEYIHAWMLVHRGSSLT